MSNKKEQSKVKLTLRQLGDPTHDDELEYEIIDTSCARWACKEILSRDDAIKLCDENDVKIIYVEEHEKISGFSLD